MIKAEILLYNIERDNDLKAILEIPRKNRYRVLSQVEIEMQLDIPMFLLFELLKNGQWDIYGLKPIIEENQEVFYIPDDFIASDEAGIENLKESQIEQRNARGYFEFGCHKAIGAYHYLKSMDIHSAQAKAVFPQSQMVRVLCNPTLMVLIVNLAKWKLATPELRLLRQAIMDAIAALEGNPFKETLAYVKSLNPKD